MKNTFWIVKTEILQGRTYFLFLFLIAVVSGASTSLIQTAERKIAELSSEEKWNADLAVVPKGITLIDFKKEILEGRSSALLPEALFDTTLGLGQGRFEATAVLTTQNGPIVEVMYKGSDQVGLDWLKSKTKLITFQDQSIYKTPEWGNKVISGFFVKGSPQAMVGLKETIDRRTVAQAILISEQIKNDQNTQIQLQKALGLYSVVMISMIFLSIGIIFLWLRTRLSVSLRIFDEIGFSKAQSFHYSVVLFFLFIVVPVLLGYFIIRSSFSI